MMKKIISRGTTIIILCVLGSVALAFLFALRNAPAPQYIGEDAANDLKDFYMIEMGDDTFRIPVEYLLDHRLRKDGPQEYVPMMAKRDNLEPIENAKQYNREPARKQDAVEFNLNPISSGDNITRSLYSDAKIHETLEVPDFSGETDGLKSLGTYMLAGDTPINTYIYLKREKIIAVIRCGTDKTYENPSCRVAQSYREFVGLDINFDIENLDWFATEGMEHILATVENWRVKTKKTSSTNSQQ